MLMGTKLIFQYHKTGTLVNGKASNTAGMKKNNWLKYKEAGRWLVNVVISIICTKVLRQVQST